MTAEPRRYLLKPFEVEAMRWEPYKPASREAMTAWLTALGVEFLEIPAEHPADWFLRIAGTADLTPGSWVVRNRDGRVFPLSAQEFTANYEPVEETR